MKEKEIKTKSSRKTIRTLDKTTTLASKMKQGLSRSKDQFKNLSDDSHVSPEEYAQDNIKYTSENIARDTVHASKETVRKTYDGGKKLVEQIKQRKRDADNIKQTAKSTGKQTFKKVKKDIKTAGKSAQRGAKTAENTARTTIKTTEKATKTAERSVKAAEKAAKVAAKTAKAVAKIVAKIAKVIAKAIASAIKSIASAIAAGGWVAVVVIIVIVLVALIVASCFGIFYSSGDTDGLTMQGAISDINAEYNAKIDEAKNSASHDLLEMSGSRARWQEVLAIYAVKTTTDQDNAQEVATMDEGKLELLRSVFWDMHEISTTMETKTVTEYTETTDDDGNIVVTETEVEKTVMYITVSHLTVDEMKSHYGFNDEQKAQLDELLADDKANLWSAVLNNVGNDDIVAVARSQLGNVGGEPYWSWCGFTSRVEWCACFVSWCANECGYVDAGVIPKTAGCIAGVDWFKDRGEWQDNTYTPKPGDIIYFDWNNQGWSGDQDGIADHVGIVEKVVDNTIYTIEGNSGDQCAERMYAAGYYEVLGFGVPQY